MNFIQYNFQQEIDPVKWGAWYEGTWFPSTNGVALQFFINGEYVNVTGTPNQSGGNKWISYSGMNVPPIA